MINEIEIGKLANRKNVRKVAVENFLCSLGDLTYGEAMQNLNMDANLYKWNAPTRNAIQKGLDIHYRE